MVRPIGLMEGRGMSGAGSTVGRPDELVEIGLFLTRGQADALIELSRLRRESVGQILRTIIHRELAEPAPSV